MTTPSIVILILLSYGTAMLLISRRASRRIRSFQDTIAAPGQTSLFLLAGSAIGGQIGSGFVIGGAEYGARYGIAGAWYGIGCGFPTLSLRPCAVSSAPITMSPRPIILPAVTAVMRPV